MEGQTSVVQDYMYRDSSGKEATVTINMTESRAADSDAANAKVGLPENQKDILGIILMIIVK